jgi:hypothetical protein
MGKINEPLSLSNKLLLLPNSRVKVINNCPRLRLALLSGSDKIIFNINTICLE